MSDFPRGQPRTRAKVYIRMPLTKVIMAAEVRSHLLSEVQGSLNDAGVAWPFIARYVNGGRKVYGTERD